MTATAKKPRRTEPVSFEQLAEQKLRSTLEEYRAAVERQAGGEELAAPELDRVAELLEVLRLPEISWAHHVQAVRELNDARAERRKIEAVLEAEAAEGRELAQEIPRLQKRLEEIQLRRQTLARTPHRLTETYRREHEAQRLYPEVALPLEDAVAVGRRKATEPTRAAEAPAESSGVGWSR